MPVGVNWCLRFMIISTFVAGDYLWEEITAHSFTSKKFIDYSTMNLTSNKCIAQRHMQYTP